MASVFQSFFSNAPGPHQPGDIIVYQSNNKPLTNTSQITHTGIVVGDDLIESKWGTIPAVFVHPTWYIPEAFGNKGTYYRPEITGQSLLIAVKNKLAETAVKERYDEHARENQQYLFNLIQQHSDNTNYCNQIWDFLENHMNVHVDLPNKDGITARMHAKKIGDRRLIGLLSAYKEHKK